VRELVPDVVAADELQDLPDDAAQDGAQPQLAPADGLRGRQPEREPEQADVEDQRNGRGQDGDRKPGQDFAPLMKPDSTEVAISC
jgi:hypothetical protein